MTFTPTQIESIKRILLAHTTCMNCGNRVLMGGGGWLEIGKLKLIRLCKTCMQLAAGAVPPEGQR